MKYIHRRLQYNMGSQFNNSPKDNKGFTLIEMLVSVAIFTLMTTYLIVKYGTFNQNILLTNTAYDIALTIRQAQNFGTNTQRSSAVGNFSDFQPAFGVSFSTLNPGIIDSLNPYGTAVPSNATFVFFPDIHPPNGGNMKYDTNVSNEISVRTLYALRRGVRVTALCAGSETSCSSTTKLDIAFKRPSPNALISSANSSNLPFARITIQTDDGSFVRTIAVREFGQIVVEN